MTYAKIIIRTETIRLHFALNKSKTFYGTRCVCNRFNLLYPKLNSMQQLNFHFHLCSTKSKTKKSLSHKMNSLVAHDQLANLNFGKLRINSKILRISFVHRNIRQQRLAMWIKVYGAQAFGRLARNLFRSKRVKIQFASLVSSQFFSVCCIWFFFSFIRRVKDEIRTRKKMCGARKILQDPH